MVYPKNFQRKKTIFTLAISIAVIGFSLGMAFLLNPSLVSEKPKPTLIPEETPSVVEGEFVMKDEALIRAIKKQLKIEDRDVTKEDVEGLMVLDFTEETVKDLTGLEFAVHLKELRLKVLTTDISPLSSLYIEKLTLLSDISLQPLMEDISKMKYLQYIDLSDCGISVIGFLSELPMLQTLILDNNRISDLEYVSEMRLLSTLSIKNCGLKNITALYGNMTIMYFYFDDNLIEDLETVKSMTSLKEYTYSGNPIKEQ